MEVLGTVFGTQLIVVLLLCVAGFVAVTSDRAKLRSLSVLAQLAAFLVSFAIGGFYVTFLERSFVAAVGPGIVLLVLAFSVWRIRTREREAR